MKFREFLESGRNRYSEILLVLMFIGIPIATAHLKVPSNLFFIYYIVLGLILAVTLYFTYRIFRSGNRKKAMLILTGCLTISLIFVFFLRYAHNVLYPG